MNFFLSPKMRKWRQNKWARPATSDTLYEWAVNLWICLNIDTILEWSCYYCGVVDHCFGVDNYTGISVADHLSLVAGRFTNYWLSLDSSMMLRKYEPSRADEAPTFTIYVPHQGFRIYKLQKLSGSAVAAHTAHKVALVVASRVDFSVTLLSGWITWRLLQIN